MSGRRYRITCLNSMALARRMWQAPGAKWTEIFHNERWHDLDTFVFPTPGGDRQPHGAPCKRPAAAICANGPTEVARRPAFICNSISASFVIALPEDAESRKRAEGLAVLMGMASIAPDAVIGIDCIKSIEKDGRYHRAILNKQGIAVVGAPHVSVHAMSKLTVPGTFGCAWSHLSVLEKARQANFGDTGAYACVLEDDARFGKFIKGDDAAKGRHVAHVLTRFLTGSRSIDVVWLGGAPCVSSATGQKNPPVDVLSQLVVDGATYHLMRVDFRMYRTHAYVIRRNATEPVIRRIRSGMAADHALAAAVMDRDLIGACFSLRPSRILSTGDMVQFLTPGGRSGGKGSTIRGKVATTRVASHLSKARKKK